MGYWRRLNSKKENEMEALKKGLVATACIFGALKVAQWTGMEAWIPLTVVVVVFFISVFDGMEAGD